MKADESNKTRLEQYTELSKKSLVRVQFSCGGNSTGIDEDVDYIPIVPEEMQRKTVVEYKMASEEDVDSILILLKTNQLPISDLGQGHRMFFVAYASSKVIACVAIEDYKTDGILRSLAVDTDFQKQGIGQKLLTEAETWALNNGLKCLYLLTNTASDFFLKQNWQPIERANVPNEIAQSTEFVSICPSTAICMIKTLNK